MSNLNSLRLCLLAAVNIVGFHVVPAVASTTIERKGYCSYANSDAKTVFDGLCEINWGIAGVAPCNGAAQGDIAERYLVSFTAKSSFTLSITCNGSVYLDAERVWPEFTMRDGDVHYIIHTESGEIYQFERISDDEAYLQSDTPNLALHRLWSERVLICKGNSWNVDTAQACGERDAYLRSLHVLGACKNDSPDSGCDLKSEATE